MNVALLCITLLKMLHSNCYKYPSNPLPKNHNKIPCLQRKPRKKLFSHYLKLTTMKGGVVVVVVVVILGMALFMVETGQAAVTCGQVASSLAPCVPYLTRGGAPTTVCCNGVRTVQQMTPTTPDRQAACQCIKQVANQNKNIRPDTAAQLPTLCGVNAGVPISGNVDCSRIS